MYKYCLYILLFSLCNLAVAQPSHLYYGKATFYSKKFDGRKTYAGERFSSIKYTGAHRSFPLQSLVKITNPVNNKSVIVRINDRFHRKNFIDISLIAAKQIDIIRQGTAKVTFQLLDSSFMQEYLDQNIKNTTLNEPISQLISDTDSYKTNQQYYIRLASFKLKKNAELLIAKNLTKIQKQHTSIHKSKYKRKALYKVIMGPFSTKEEANIEIAKLQSHFKDVLLINNILH